MEQLLPMLNETLDLSDLEPIEVTCLRCGSEHRARFVGLCPDCAAQLYEKYPHAARAVEDAAYVPKMNVTPNAVALKDD